MSFYLLSMPFPVAQFILAEGRKEQDGRGDGKSQTQAGLGVVTPR